MNGLQRKIFYFWADPSTPANLWSFFLKGEVDGVNNLPIRFVVQNGPLGGGTYSSPEFAYLNFNRWYSIEVEIQNTTTAASPWDGTVRVWIDGTKVYDAAGWGLNRTYDDPLKLFWFGQQCDRTNYNPINEYRYIDDVVVSTSYIGP